MTRKDEIGKRKGVYLIVVDESEELTTAIDYACQFANAEGGYVALLYVVEQVFVQNWQNIEDRVRQEMRQKAEQIIWDAAGLVKDKTGTVPMVFIKEGDCSDIVVQTLEDNNNIVSLILAASAHSSNPGPLVTYFSGKGVSRIPVPLMIIPGHLT
ncbi:MAG: universal stress protein [Alphaproteobacteria bacterium]